MTITIPPQLADATDEDDQPGRAEWLSALPGLVRELATEWELELGEPYAPGGQCAWVAPAKSRGGDELALKVGWRHREAEHEAAALRVWDGDGAVRCVAARALAQTTVLLLERCDPGVALKLSRPEPQQDVVIAGLMRRLWAHLPPEGHPFAPLQEICALWADSLESRVENDHHSLDHGLGREAIAIFRELPQTAERDVLLCTDLHAENVLSARREPWLMIDPKPFVGDPAFEPVQHILNCDQRLATDPQGIARRMAGLLELDPARVKLWLFARCAQESYDNPTMRAPAVRLAP